MAGASAQQGPPGAENVEVIEMSREEYEAAKGRALKELGLTYDELRDQARRRDFSSPRAHRLWVMIGGAASA